MNRVKTVVLLAMLTALLLWAGQALGGQTGLAITLALAATMHFGAWWFSDRLVLRWHGAREVTEAEAPILHRVVRDLARRRGMPVPRVYVIPEEAPNAFATGRGPERAAVAVTEGLLRLLDRDELTGVLGHELAHVKNRDTLVMTVAATLGGAISMLANIAQWGLLLGSNRSADEHEEGTEHPVAGLIAIIVAPFAAVLIQAAVSRSREFMADEVGALARALAKLETWSRRLPMNVGSPATAHLFIVNPFTGGGMLQLFSTHPPTEARIARLTAMADAMRRGRLTWAS